MTVTDCRHSPGKVLLMRMYIFLHSDSKSSSHNTQVYSKTFPRALAHHLRENWLWHCGIADRNTPLSIASLLDIQDCARINTCLPIISDEEVPRAAEEEGETRTSQVLEVVEEGHPQVV